MSCDVLDRELQQMQVFNGGSIRSCSFCGLREGVSTHAGAVELFRCLVAVVNSRASGNREMFITAFDILFESMLLLIVAAGA